MHYETGLYFASYKEMITVDEAKFRSTARDELTRIKNFLSIISTPFLTFLIPFVIFNAEIWQCLSSEFSNPAYIAVTFIFPTCKNIVEYVYEISCCVKHFWISIKKTANISYIYRCLISKKKILPSERKIYCSF